LPLGQNYEKRWPIGTKERVWLDVLCFVGPRRGDACMIGRQHIRKTPDGDVLQFRTEKGQEEVEVTIPILPVLARTLSVGPTGDFTFICGAGGRPFTKESFGNAFSEAARKAGASAVTLMSTDDGERGSRLQAEYAT
jgi:hypothetical protein